MVERVKSQTLGTWARINQVTDSKLRKGLAIGGPTLLYSFVDRLASDWVHMPLTCVVGSFIVASIASLGVWGVSNRSRRIVNEGWLREAEDNLKAREAELAEIAKGGLDIEEVKRLRETNAGLLGKNSELEAKVSESEAQLSEYGATFRDYYKLRVFRGGDDGVDADYLLSDKIGEGGLGTVKFAINLNMGNRLEVIKIAKREVAIDEDYRARFFNEARIMLNDLHNQPRVVEVYGYGELDRCPFIVMEFVRGNSLAREIKNHGSLGFSRAANWMIEIADAFVKIHRAGIIHRDVKPDNIMITEEGKIKIIDFGIAKVTGREITNKTKAGSIFGTPEYMAPEQVEGKGVSNQTDLYALGLIFYEMLTGRSPFLGKTERLEFLTLMNRLNASWNKWSQGDFPKIARETGIEDKEGKLQKIIEKLLNPKTKYRYSKAEKLVADLRDLLGIEATPYETTSPGDGPAGIHKK